MRVISHNVVLHKLIGDSYGTSYIYIYKKTKLGGIKFYLSGGIAVLYTEMANSKFTHPSR